MSTEKLYELYNKCVEAGYNGNLDEFIDELESIVSEESKKIEGVSEEDIMKISGGTNLGQKISAGALSALVLGTSTGFAETLKSNQNINKTITNTQKSKKQNEYLINKYDKNKLIKILGIGGTAIGAVILTAIIYHKIKTAKDFEDALKVFSEAVDKFDKNEEIIKICLEFEKQLLKELNKRNVNHINWEPIDLTDKTNEKAVQEILKHIIDGLNILQFDKNNDVKNCISKLSKYLSENTTQNMDNEGQRSNKNNENMDEKEEDNNSGEDLLYTRKYIDGVLTITIGIQYITKEKVEKLAKKHSLSEENKINLVIETCNVGENAFCACQFINELTIKDTVVERNGFQKATITNLTLNEGVIVDKYGFWGAEIKNLTLSKGVTVNINHGFIYATITNLTLNAGAKVDTGCFKDTIITNLTLYKGVTVDEFSFKKALITNLILYEGVNVNKFSFQEATITNLTLNEGVIVDKYGFWGAEIKNLTLSKGVIVDKYGFFMATICRSAKYNDGGNIPREILNGWGFSQINIVEDLVNFIWPWPWPR